MLRLRCFAGQREILFLIILGNLKAVHDSDDLFRLYSVSATSPLLFRLSDPDVATVNLGDDVEVSGLVQVRHLLEHDQVTNVEGGVIFGLVSF